MTDSTVEGTSHATVQRMSSQLGKLRQHTTHHITVMSNGDNWDRRRLFHRHVCVMVTQTMALHAYGQYRARQLYKNISMLFLFPVTRDLLFTNI